MKAKKTYKLIFKDKDLIVIDKPAGLLVHPLASNPAAETLTKQLISEFPEIKKVGEDPNRPGLVHRLDKNTSGVMVVARTQPAFLKLKEAFKKRTIQKKYLALVHGVLAQDQLSIDMPISRSAKGYFSARHAADVEKLKSPLKEHYRPAKTQIKEIERFLKFTLVAALPKTGRTHQIRVHLKAVGYPIVGDQIYSSVKERDLAKKEFDLSRQFLHAASIVISHPTTGKEIKFESPLAPDLQRILSQLQINKK